MSSIKSALGGYGEGKLRICGVSVHMYGTLSLHEGAQCKHEKSNVSTLSSFVNV